MGNQVNFYMTPQDEESFVSHIRSDPNVCIFMDRVQNPEITPLDTLPDRDVPGWFNLWIWDRRNSPLPKYRYVEKQKHYVVDFFYSEVIQFSRSGFDNNRLVRGRIWAELIGFDRENPTLRIEKREPFKKLFKHIANYIRRNGTKNEAGDFLLPGALKYVENGGVLCQVPVGTIINLVHLSIAKNQND